ncbi:hypothetical protein FRX31_017125 [Thalictrum thalictroides]|uniref:Adenine nucleotide alpha hydrolases-like superfamily protein n=1 Tax=Thalictrum thalictroides TaxID=46969 RepID=A0A7J6W785_THATH|nr:hypothetical protein FRX31_017125 [Thalictrum thalictroides]
MEMKSEEAEASSTMQQEQVQMPLVLEEKKKKKVLVAIDESDGSIYALKWVLDNLFFHDSSTSHVVDEHQKDEEAGVVILVHVQQPFQHYIFPVGHGVLVFSLFLFCINTDFI